MKLIQQPQPPVPSAVVLSPAVTQALRLARSAHLELGFTLAIQTAYMGGTRTPADVHALLTRPPAKLARHFLRVVSRAGSNFAEWHPPWEILAGQFVALDQQYRDLVARLWSTTCPVNHYELIQWTIAAGWLAHDLMTCSADFQEFQQLYAESALGLQGGCFLHLT